MTRGTRLRLCTALTAAAACALVISSASGTAATPNFSLALHPPKASAEIGLVTTVKVVTASLGLQGTIDLAVSHVPKGAAAGFSVNPVKIGGLSKLSVSTSSDTPPGTYTITVTATEKSTQTSHQAKLALTVRRATVSQRLLELMGGFLQQLTPGWDKPLPPKCPATPACTARYAQLDLPPRLDTEVLVFPLAATPWPTFNGEVIRIPLASPLRCNASGVVDISTLVGEAYGPYPGRFSFHPSLATLTRDAYHLYSYEVGALQWAEDDVPFYSETSFQGSLLSFGCLADGRFSGALGRVTYIAKVGTGLGDLTEDWGAAEVWVAPGIPHPAIVISLTSSTLGAGAALPAPTPVCVTPTCP